MFDGNKNLVAIRFGGYPETVLAMSDALFSGSKIALRLPKEKSETELTTHGGNYSRRMKAGDTASECVLKANGDEKKEKDESPRDLYIFCKDESGLFTELDSKLSVPLMPEWEEYFIRELKDRKILKRLNVFSTNTEFAAYAVTLKKGETQIAKILTDGLESGEICIPNAKKDDTAFRDIETFTQYLNAFGKDIAKKIQATFKPVFNPAEEGICPELNEVNEYIRQNTGYSLYEAQLAGAEAIKRQLKKEKMTMLVSGCGTGKTKIGSAALYAYQKSIGGGRRINVITCPSHVAKKWVRELYETVPNCIARVVSSITDVDRMYELYKTSDKSVFMVLSKESARSGYLRKPKMTVSPGFVSGIGNRYLEKCRYEDFYSRVSEWEDAEKLNEEEWQRFISDARIPEEINAGLSDTYQSEYWNAVCEAAHKLLNEYLEKHLEETK